MINQKSKVREVSLEVGGFFGADDRGEVGLGSGRDFRYGFKFFQQLGFEYFADTRHIV